MLNVQPIEPYTDGMRQGLSQRKGHMLRVGVAVAGDLLRESISGCLQDNPSMEVHPARSVREVMYLIQKQQIRALILDDQFDPNTWIGHLVSRFKQDAADNGVDLAILIVGSFADGALIRELFEAGIDGYLFRGDDLRPLFAASIETICVHKPYLSPTVSSEYTQMLHSGRGRKKSWLLDNESKKVLRMLADGKRVPEIAQALNCNTRRVYWLRTKLRRRFHATTNEKVIMQAELQGYLKSDKALDV
jgi:DNA-binding NarL/FixJ family response regulator